jgi:hypothetical protein
LAGLFSFAGRTFSLLFTQNNTPKNSISTCNHDEPT